MIETWIEEIKSLLRDRLSSLEASLLPPADNEDILEAEQAMNVSFPTELKELYSLHNGEARSGPGLFFGLQFLTLNEMVNEWKIWSDLHEEYVDMGDHYSIPSEWIKEQYINRQWIPFCHDGGGNHLGIDLDPGPEGVVGQVINFGRDEETKFVIARNIGEFIHFMHHTVTSGNYTVVQEEGSNFWVYGRSDQARLLRDAQQYAFGAEWDTIKKQPSAEELSAWEVNLPPEWQEQIKQKYGSAEQFTSLYQIYLPNQQIRDIRPLAACTHVRELSLSRNRIDDLAPLVHCRELKKLYLMHNPIHDLNPLAQLPYLRQLNISDTDVTSLEPLANLQRLVELECERIPAKDYTPLLRIPTLECLTISSPDVAQAATIAEMKQLKQLTVLGADQWGESQWAALADLSLVSLTVTGVKWQDMRYIRLFTNLKSLTLANAEVNDIAGLSELPVLQKLKLVGDNVIANPEAIAQCTTLSSFTGNEADVQLLQETFKQPVSFSIQYGGNYNA